MEGCLTMNPSDEEGAGKVKGGLNLNSTDKELTSAGSTTRPARAQRAEEARLNYDESPFGGESK